MIESITLSYWIFSVPIIYLWIILLQTSGIWIDLVPAYRSYYSQLEPFLLDYFFIIFYVLIYFMILSRLPKQTFFMQAVILFIVITVLDVIYGFLVRQSQPRTMFLRFFQKWAKLAGYRAIIWDFVYIGLILLGAKFINSYVNDKPMVWGILSFIMIFILTWQYQ